MSKSLCIVSPNDDVGNNLFYFELYPNQYHEEVLFEYCNNKNLAFCDVISMAANGYLYIPINGDLCLIFSPNNLGKTQKEKFLEFMDTLYDNKPSLKVSACKTNEKGQIVVKPTQINGYDELIEFFNINLEERKIK